MKTVLFFLLLVSIDLSAQEYIFGKVLSEDGRELQDVSVVNISNQQTSTTNSDGNFMIFAKIGDEIRFTKERYTRVSKSINGSNISKSFLINLIKIPYEIDEVEIKYRLTGDLKKDADHFGKSNKILKFEKEMDQYIKKRSSPETMSAQKGDFVQPIDRRGVVVPIGLLHSQYDDIDLNQDLRKNIPEEFFLKELNLKPAEIPNFIFYVLRNFERKDIIKYGKCESSDYARFELEALKKVKDYKKNVQNESKNKSNDLQLKDKNLNNGLWW